MKALVVAEHGPDGLADATRRAVTAARTFADRVDVLVAGENCDPAARSAAMIAGVSEVLVADGATVADGIAEPLAALVATLAAGYDAVLAPATTFGKNVLPRAAAKLDVPLVSDVLEITAPGVYRRAMNAGNAVATVESDARPQLLTVRPAAFVTAADASASAPNEQPADAGASAPNEQPADASASAPNEQPTDASAAAPVTKVDPPAPWTRTRLESAAAPAGDGPDLATARIVFAGGRGLGSTEAFAALSALAARVGGAVGATRAAVDSGYAANDLQIGQSGKVVAPALYVAVGVSGAIQHLAGMRDSAVVVAINHDESAPIIDHADIVWVEDLFAALKQIDEALTRRGR